MSCLSYRVRGRDRMGLGFFSFLNVCREEMGKEGKEVLMVDYFCGFFVKCVFFRILFFFYSFFGRGVWLLCSFYRWRY